MGLLDALSGLNDPNGGLANAVASPLFNLGAGLLSARYTPFSNGGQGLLQGAQSFANQRQAQQQYQQNQLQLNMLKQQLPMLQGLFQQLQGGQQPQQQQALVPPGAQPSGAQTMPLAAAPPAAPGAAPTAGTQPGGLLGAPAQQAQDPRGNILNMFRLGTAYSLFPMTEKAGAGMIEQAKFLAQTDPQLATQLELAKSAVSQDQALLQQAQQSGNSTMIQGATMKLLKDLGLVSVANNNGAVTTFGGISPQSIGMSGVNPAQGIQIQNGVEAPIPGAVGAQAALSGAKAGAESAAEYVPVYNNEGKAVGNLPKGTDLSKLGSIGGGLSFNPGPGAEETAKGQGELANKTNGEFQEQAETANTMLTQVETLKQDAANFTPGPLAQQRAFALRALLGAGLITDDQAKQLGAYESGEKVKTQLQAMVTKQLGSREAAQVFSVMGKSIPGLDLSPVGLQNISAYQEGIARYQMARAAYANNLYGQNDYKGVNGARDAWIKQSNPLYYIVASAPPDIQKSMLQSMGKAKATKFVNGWRAAAANGFAAPPGAFNAGP